LGGFAKYEVLSRTATSVSAKIFPTLTERNEKLRKLKRKEKIGKRNVAAGVAGEGREEMRVRTMEKCTIAYAACCSSHQPLAITRFPASPLGTSGKYPID